jgi:hypothetical protein
MTSAGLVVREWGLTNAGTVPHAFVGNAVAVDNHISTGSDSQDVLETGT